MQGWQNFAGHIPQEERSDLVAAYHRRLTSADTAVRDAAVGLHIWFTYLIVWYFMASSLMHACCIAVRFVLATCTSCLSEIFILQHPL